MTEQATGRDWVGVRELADELGVPWKTVYGWNSKGTGPRAARFGRHVKFRRCDVEAWVERQYGPPAA